MAKWSGLVLMVAILVVVSFFEYSTTRVNGSGDYQIGWIPARSSCDGTMEECFSGNEFEMDTEIKRRILATSGYISYAALKRNSVPCSKRGASYYNCKSGAQANPYSRGCSAITRCRGG